MSQQKQFEGPDVRVLLDEICTTYGTDPTITRAETFRTGGVLGFFQREHYRLVVDDPYDGYDGYDDDPTDVYVPSVDTEVRAALEAGPEPDVRPKGGRHFAGKPPRAGRSSRVLKSPRSERIRPSRASAIGAELAAYLEATDSEPFFSSEDHRTGDFAEMLSAETGAGAGAVHTGPEPVGVAFAAGPVPAPPGRASGDRAGADLFGELADSMIDDTQVTAAAPPARPAHPTVGAPVVAPAPRAAGGAGQPRRAPMKGRATMKGLASITGMAGNATNATPTGASGGPRIRTSSRGGAAAAPRPGYRPPVDEMATAALETMDETGSAPAAPAAGDRPSFDSVLRKVAQMIDDPQAGGGTDAELLGAQLFAAANGDHGQGIGGGTGGGTANGNHGQGIGVGTDDAIDGEGGSGNLSHLEAEQIFAAYAGDDEDDEAAWDAAALRMRLVRCGLDAVAVDMVEAAVAGGRPVEAALLDLFAAQPRAPRPPRRPGSLVVVIGPAGRAAEEATRIAAEVGSDPSRIAVATTADVPTKVRDDLLIRNADEAAEMAGGHRRGRIGVVAVDNEAGSRSTAWARHIIDALRPTLLLAVVDAMYKTEDVEEWIESLGGVDGIIVDNVAYTASPGRILDLELPISRIDNQPATPVRWVATILDRLDMGTATKDTAGPGAALTEELMNLVSCPPAIGGEAVSGTWP
ncbi:MAG: hypothetical protein KGQ66_03825 [Acidobacteriota bacterium]|nr:hypothetical protein [Acidobacteriota bacterium]